MTYVTNDVFWEMEGGAKRFSLLTRRFLFVCSFSHWIEGVFVETLALQMLKQFCFLFKFEETLFLI